MRNHDPDWSSHDSSAIGCLLKLIFFCFVIYALVGLFAGYLIIPNRDDASNANTLEGLPARIGGGSLLVAYFGFYLTTHKQIGRWAGQTGGILMAIGALGFGVACFAL